MANGRFTVSILRRRNGRRGRFNVGGDGMKYTPPIEFTLVAHDVVKGTHLESGPTALSLGDQGWTAWSTFGHTPNELFGDLCLAFGLSVQDVVIDDDYAHFRFHTTDVNQYTLIPMMDMAVYIGDKYTNVISYVQWNYVIPLGYDRDGDAYMFGLRAKKVPNGT